MASADALRQTLRLLSTKSYYDVLGVAPTATLDAVQEAFHAFSRQYHPDVYLDDPDAQAAATDVFKRAVEAYRCLSRPASRERYDRGLARGQLRASTSREEAPPPPPPPEDVQTLADLARTPEGGRYAQRADALLAEGNLEGARNALESACKQEPFNSALSERLHLLYDALDLGGRPWG
jgi:curved DNA-binding protein CbpA